MPRTAILWLLAGLVYLLWPYDLVPDFLVLVGWIDDLLIAGFTALMAWKTLKKSLKPPRRPPPDIDRDTVIDAEIEKDD
ncbi:MAG: hypothetical protein AUJ52_13735 [Elusimicrobia bacterium CG1_02_63_36]|nr:MAG: hypothetical protein AUJ52_13735 [Elusimicrobia bacterium CG1_02_63_36]PIP82266.1 MAG: hypothetical protein COR54_15735 [Elusimicrobia bacterium CG22_combo_CG10-13_8_21_14_all_63_91]PJA15316.1 MAG: hypothetical protein COX66_10355 [Elusimicrobia bacterium CG_4_10_14_0_2_um_filter_63_34]PJB26999.1 MAG: hypothetical protein CO113_00845 [Elusimicrobia bacterium CG_4_9_14_3_um_filter_62_55]